MTTIIKEIEGKTIRVGETSTFLGSILMVLETIATGLAVGFAVVFLIALSGYLLPAHQIVGIIMIAIGSLLVIRAIISIKRSKPEQLK